jgi:hypothetical protein
MPSSDLTTSISRLPGFFDGISSLDFTTLWGRGRFEQTSQDWITALGSVEAEEGLYVVTEVDSFDLQQEAIRTLYHYALEQWLILSQESVRVHLPGPAPSRAPVSDETVDIDTLGGTRPSGRRYADLRFRPYVAAELDRLRHLSGGWDGYHSRPIDPGIVEAARTLVFQLPPDIAPRPRVVPLASGTLQFEWGNDEVALELEFESPTTIRFLKWNPAAGDPQEDTMPVADQEGIEALVRWYTRQDV